MDVKLLDAAPTSEERLAVDAVVGSPESAWDGGARGNPRDAFTATFGGRETRARRQLLLPALQALQSRVGWISERGLGYVCTRLDVPPADAWGVATFYAMLATSPRPRRVLHLCDDIGCRARGARVLCESLEQAVGPAIAHGPAGDQVTQDAERAAWMRAPCLGLCDRAPAALLVEAGARPTERSVGGLTATHAVALLSGAQPGPDAANAPPITRSTRTGRTPPLLQRVRVVDPTDLDAYRSVGGFSALRRALEMGGEAVIREVTDAKLVGRGGAGFPTGRKWEAVRAQRATPHYLVCNADESEPGTFKDRVLLTEDPFAIVEAMTIAGFATGCERGFVYLRAEYPLAYERLHHAIERTRDAGLLGSDILGRGVRFDLEIRRGAGAYICGEETAIFESIEGKRGEPRNKPPFPVTHGLFGKPTLVNNVETLANVLPILLEGSAAFTSVGTPHSTGTRLFCLSGCVERPGVYEVPMGTTLRELLTLAGLPSPASRLQAVLFGGAAGTFVHRDELDLHLTHEDTRATGTSLGSGVVMAFDDSVDLRDIVLRIAAFFRDESCGQCVPCRVGTVRQEEVLHRIASGRTRGGIGAELALLDEIGLAMEDGSICGLGQTAYSAVESAVKQLGLFGPEGSARP